MLLSVVGSENACRVVVDLIAQTQPYVTGIQEDAEGVEYSCVLSLGDDVEEGLISVTTGMVQGANCVIYAIENEVEAGDVVNQQNALGGRQPPFATVITQSCHEEQVESCFEKNRFYLGQYLCTPEDGEGLIWAVYHAMFTPAHVLWDRPENDFTAVGWRAMQRMFWWFDRDLDDAWNDRELSAFLQALKGRPATSAEVDETKQFIRDQQAELAIDNFVSKNGNLTHYAVIALCEGWLKYSSNEDYWETLRGLWGVLFSTGTHRTGLPWSAADLDAVKVNPTEDLLQLSYTGAQFLKSVYEEKFSSSKNLWRFTPSTQWSAAGEPPWADVHGLPGSRDDPAEYTLEAFIASWRFTTARKYQHLIVFSRCWGFDPSEDPSVLFVKKRKREFRTSEIDLPNILQCLVLGSPRCGKTALRRRLADPYHNSGDNEDAYATTQSHSLTLVPQKDGETERFDLVLHELPDRDVPTLLKDRSFMSHIDAVLLCYDGDDVYSFSYIAEKYPMVAQHKIPMLLVMTKMDLVGEDLCNLQDQEYAMQPNEFAQKWGLCWPPALVSNQAPSATLKELNEVDELPLSVSMLCRHPECHVGKQRASACKIACRLCTLTSLLAGAVAGCAVGYKRLRGGSV